MKKNEKKKESRPIQFNSHQFFKKSSKIPVEFLTDPNKSQNDPRESSKSLKDPQKSQESQTDPNRSQKLNQKNLKNSLKSQKILKKS